MLNIPLREPLMNTLMETLQMIRRSQTQTMSTTITYKIWASPPLLIETLSQERRMLSFNSVPRVVSNMRLPSHLMNMLMETLLKIRRFQTPMMLLITTFKTWDSLLLPTEISSQEVMTLLFNFGLPVVKNWSTPLRSHPTKLPTETPLTIRNSQTQMIRMIIMSKTPDSVLVPIEKLSQRTRVSTKSEQSLFPRSQRTNLTFNTLLNSHLTSMLTVIPLRTKKSPTLMMSTTTMSKTWASPLLPIETSFQERTMP